MSVRDGTQPLTHDLAIIMESTSKEISEVSASILEFLNDSPKIFLFTLFPYVLGLSIFKMFFSNLKFKFSASLYGKLFSTIFTLCFCLQELIIFEICSILSPRMRWFLWKTNLFLISFFVLIILPFFLFYYLFSNESNSFYAKTVYTIISQYIFLSLFLFFSREISFILNGTPALEFNLEYCIACIGALGVLTSAILSGYGAATSPFKHLHIFINRYNTSDIFLLESRIYQIEKEITEKQENLDRLTFVKSHMSAGKARSSKLKRISSIMFGNSINTTENQMAALKTSTSQLIEMKYHLSYELKEVQKEVDRTVQSTTWYGSYRNCLGYVFTVYCIYKLTMAAINIVFLRDAKRDPITWVFEVFLFFFNVELPLIYAQGLAFLLVGVLALNSFRGFIVTMTNIFYSVPSATMDVTLLILCEIMSLYFVATVLLMRINLPEQYRLSITKVLGNIEFVYFHRWFDRVFIISALVSFILTVLLNQQRKNRAQSFRQFRYKLR